MQLHSQRGGTFLGFIIGLVLGLAVALAVAIYVTKVPTPFSNKNQTRSTDQDVQETEKNKDWNPNSVFQPKPPADAPAAPSAPAADATTDKSASGTTGKSAAEAPKAEPRPAVTADPLGDLVKSKAAPVAASGGSDPFTYFVQVGAFRSQAEADAQRAKLTMMGLDAKISEREQAGRQVYRVRLGPYDDKDVAERTKSKLDAGGIETALVRVQR